LVRADGGKGDPASENSDPQMPSDPVQRPKHAAPADRKVAKWRSHGRRRRQDKPGCHPSTARDNPRRLLFCHARREPRKNVVDGDTHPANTGFISPLPRFDCDPLAVVHRGFLMVSAQLIIARWSRWLPEVRAVKGVHEISEPGPFSSLR